MSKKILKAAILEIARALNKTVEFKKSFKELTWQMWALENELADYVNKNMFTNDYSSEIELLKRVSRI